MAAYDNEEMADELAALGRMRESAALRDYLMREIIRVSARHDCPGALSASEGSRLFASSLLELLNRDAQINGPDHADRIARERSAARRQQRERERGPRFGQRRVPLDPNDDAGN